jgi:hypothetical protein
MVGTTKTQLKSQTPLNIQIILIPKKRLEAHVGGEGKTLGTWGIHWEHSWEPVGNTMRTWWEPPKPK